MITSACASSRSQLNPLRPPFLQVIETLVSAQDVTSYTWNVNVAAGTSVTLGLTDSTGTSAYAAQVSPPPYLPFSTTFARG